RAGLSTARRPVGEEGGIGPLRARQRRRVGARKGGPQSIRTRWWLSHKDAGADSAEIDAIDETGADEDCTALELGAAASRLS
ncbi:hypothetical protein THAOC_25791, partial [Thalassiosira oceanica]